MEEKHRSDELEVEGSGSRRTRSQVDTDWTLTDSLILVNEIAAVEGDCLDALSTYQKWKIIAENCTALGVSRTLNQFRRKWDTLLSEYNKIKQSEGNGKRKDFDKELFGAIDNVVRVQKDRSVSDADSDPEEPDTELIRAMAEAESRKQRNRITPQKRRIKEVDEVKEEKEQKGNAEEEEDETSNEEKEEMLASMLRENAEMIHEVLKGKLTENKDYKLADLKKDEAARISQVRCQGDKLIECFGAIASTLNQLCDQLQNK